jgi:hypothetical protein
MLPCIESAFKLSMIEITFSSGTRGFPYAYIGHRTDTISGYVLYQQRHARITAYTHHRVATCRHDIFHANCGRVSKI